MSFLSQKQLVSEYINSIQYAQFENLEHNIQQFISDDCQWHGFHPVNQLDGRKAIVEGLWKDFLHAFPQPERRDDIMFAGHFKDADWVCSTGHYVATFCNDWLGIKASGELTFIRYGEFYKIENNQITAIYCIYDIPHVLAQTGINVFPPSLGTEILIPGPASKDGIIMGESDLALANQAQKVVEDMIAGLMKFDGVNLDSMPIAQYWHPQFLWYGPYGIGSTRGLEGFRNGHQASFLRAFPDRVGGNHVARFAENGYVASTGWPSINATHGGGGWLGLPTTGKKITQRVMDWWRVEDGVIMENWVFIDLLDLCLQLDYDILARVAEKQRSQF